MGLKCERRPVGGLKFRGVTTMSTCIKEDCVDCVDQVNSKTKHI
jgi:hypothetical protein